jgi:hypothetical protein
MLYEWLVLIPFRFEIENRSHHLIIGLRHGWGFSYLFICHVKICHVTPLLSTLSKFTIFYINSHFPYDRFMNFWYEFLYDIWRVLSSYLLICRMIWNLLLTCHRIGMSTWTLVVPILRFLLIFPFRDVTTIKRLLLNNQDIQARSLVLTTVALTRV